MVEFPKAPRQRGGRPRPPGASRPPGAPGAPGASDDPPDSAQADRRRGCLGLLATLVGALYLLNPTAGFLELLPDTLPLVGNLDEAGATALLLLGLRWLGFDPLRFSKHSSSSRPPSEPT